jgi:PIN domain nuclease of toxin-antitoxin system
MNLLIDTHVFLWWVEGGRRLPVRVAKALSEESNVIYVSVASVWEIAVKKRLGKLTFSKSALVAIEANGFRELPMSGEDAELAGSMDWKHKDPFDRILVAQCVTHRLMLVSADRVIRAKRDIPQFWA